MVYALAEPLFAMNAMLAVALAGLLFARSAVRRWGDRVRDELTRRHLEDGGAYALKERELAAAEIEANRLAAESVALRRQHAKLKEGTAKIARSHFDIVHLVGEPGGDRRRYEAPLHVPGGPSGLPARVVLASHLVVVYAENLSSAKRLLEVSYASRTGYSVGPLTEAGQAPPAETAAQEPRRQREAAR